MALNMPYRAKSIDNLVSASSSSCGIETPTHSTVTNYSTDIIHPSDTVEIPPCAGHTYIIREHYSQEILTLVNGSARLESRKLEQGGYHWQCEESLGWLLFICPVSGLYLGYRKKDKLGATTDPINTSKETGAECGKFCSQRQPEGGYQLLIRRGDELRKVTLESPNFTLRGTYIVTTTSFKNEGALWDFEEVNGSNCFTP